MFADNAINAAFETRIEDAVNRANEEAASVEDTFFDETLLDDAFTDAIADFQSTEPTLPSANGIVVSDVFQDLQFVPYNLQVRNTTGQAVHWEALVENVNYSEIPSLFSGNYSVTTSQNADGTFNHLFASTEPLAAFQNFVISGGILENFSIGTGLSLFAAFA